MYRESRNYLVQNRRFKNLPHALQIIVNLEDWIENRTFHITIFFLFCYVAA